MFGALFGVKVYLFVLKQYKSLLFFGTQPDLFQERKSFATLKSHLFFVLSQKLILGKIGMKVQEILPRNIV
jgi:hypothetical protein